MTSWPSDAPSPLWRALSRETFVAPALRGDATCDVLVVGGGISGLTTALELKKRGKSVVLLEAAKIGAGASGRANGQVIAALTRHGPDAIRATLGQPFLDLLSTAADRLYGLIDTYNIDCDARRTGWLQPAHTPGRAKRTQAMAAQWAAAGAPTRALDAEEMAARIGSKAYFGGWEHRGGGHINPYAFTVGLARAAAGEGVVIHETSRVTTLSRQDGVWRATTPHGTVTASRVALATAAHTGDLWPGLRQTIVPVTSYQAATAPLGVLETSVLPGDEAFSDTRQDLRYMRKDRDGRIVSGGALAVQTFARWRLPRLISRKLGQFRRALGDLMADVLADAICDVPDDQLALRPTPLTPIPFHAFTSRTARMILPWLRWQDSREV